MSESGWQPIETAPRNGNEVLLYNGDQGTIDLASWSKSASSDCPGWVAYEIALVDTYTHWMPLPCPPEPSA